MSASLPISVKNGDNTLGGAAPPAEERIGALYLENAGDTLITVFGPPPEPQVLEAMRSMREGRAPQRPGARRIDEAGMAIRIPLQGGGAHLWRVDMSSGSEVDMIRKMMAASTALEGENSARTALGAASEATGAQHVRSNIAGTGVAFHTGLVEALAKISRTTRGKGIQRALSTISDTTGCRHPAAIRRKGKKIISVALLGRPQNDAASSIAIFARQMISRNTRQLSATTDGVETGSVEGGEPFEPDFGLFCSTHAISRFSIVLPEENGYGLYAEGDVDPQALAIAAACLTLRYPVAPASRLTHFRRYLIAGVAAALMAFFAWPTSFQIVAPGEIRPADTNVVVVPSDGRLEKILVGVGDRVEKGAVIAELVSPELEEAETRATLDHLLEELGAQEALANDDYARFQIADQRRRISEFRAGQERRRLEELTIRAPADGRITDLVPRSELGAVLRSGSLIAELRIGGRMHLLLQLAASDGPHVHAGMRGTVVVRGLVDRTYPISVLEAPVLNERNDGSSSLSVLAEIQAGEEEGLLKGLTGIARIDSGTRPRGLVWLRPILDYARLTAWKFLGLRL